MCSPLTPANFEAAMNDAIERTLASSFFRKSRGYAVYSGLPGLRELREEAAALFPHAQQYEWWEPNTGERKDSSIDEDRSISQPRRRLLSAQAGPVQRAIYHDPEL